MERREFVTAVGAVMVPWRSGGQGVRRTITTARPPVPQDPALPPEVFARRLERLRTELTTRKLDLFVVEPGTNFEYFTGYNPGRSERLILLLVPAADAPAIVCPAFDVERLKRHSGVADVRGWRSRRTRGSWYGRRDTP